MKTKTLFLGFLCCLFILVSLTQAQTPEFLWARRMGGASGDGSLSIKIDANGNVYTTGFFSGTADFNPGPGTYNLTSAGGTDIFVSKLTSYGNFVWAKQLGGAGDDFGFSIAIDDNGNVYTTGYFEGTADFDPGLGTHNLLAFGSNDAFICKLNNLGNFIWARQLGGTNPDEANSIVVDVDGNVYTTGIFFGTADFDPGPGVYNLTPTGVGCYISKLDALGNFLWAKQFTSISDINGYSIALDASGNCYITGEFQGTVDFDPGTGTSNVTSFGNRDVFICKLNDSGNFLWAKKLGGTDNDESNAIAIDINGSVYTTGRFLGTADFDPGTGTYNLTSNSGNCDAFISKLSSSGNFVWAKKFGGGLGDFASGAPIALDADRNVFTTGSFQGTIDFDPGQETYNMTHFGNNDIFISKLNASGNFLWATKMGGINDDGGFSIVPDADGNVYTTGYFYGTADFDPSTVTYNLTATGATDIFVVKLSWEMVLNEYVLKRVVNGTTEEFSLNNHAWNFKNSINNMWPQTWWSQFDYSQPQYPIAWANFSSERFPDWPLFAEAYGESQCYWNPPPGVIIYSPMAVLNWVLLSNQKFNPNNNQWYYWGGSCFGFAITSFFFFDNLKSLTSIFPGNATLHDVPLLDNSRKFINLYWTYVTGQEHEAYINQNQGITPNQTLDDIKNMFLDINRDDKVLYFSHQNGSGAHAVNPYRVGVGQSIDTIYIYDNNAPNQIRKIHINKTANTWDYPNMAGWGGSQGLFLMEPASEYLNNPILPKQSSTDERCISDNVVDNNFIEIYNSFNSDITIKNASGDSIGFKISDGNLFSNFEDGIPIIPITGSDHPPIGYYIPNDNYNIELSNVADTSVYLSFFTDSLAFSINRNNSIPTDVDKFNFESINHKLEILNPDNKTKIYDIGVIISGEESEKVLEVINLEMSLKDSLNFYPEENENLKVENLGAEKSYGLKVKLVSASGESIFEYSNISLTANSSHTILPEWQNLDSVSIYVDNGNNGTIDDSVIVVNQYTSLNDEDGIIPTEFKLFQNYPNPFNPITTIKYSVAEQSKVTIIIYDVLGREVATLINEEKQIGNYSIEFNANNISSGIYFYRIQAGSFVDTKKMILIK